ncbi:hypothetical protein FD723_10290 [Nostoc sp. C052]|uniref:hypothetical protein n=1 Tax=Nostoc sp. C052 TaxID=2576902 RepID=UPI0015C3CFD9|nr:hypothetical protein [Nostoc sp. C052]QLE40811.1 hypothetical protein FD723_10290 [Nostoc sp. C052]
MSASIKEFEIWVGLDEYDAKEKQSLDDEFCNAIICYPDGSRITLNIWSENYLHKQINNLDCIDKQVAILPDIVVRNFNSDSIRKAITNLVNNYSWLEGRGFPALSCE